MATRTLLSQTTLAGAGTTTGSTVEVGNAVAVTVQSKFLYGAGGTTCKVFIQTTIDGTNWIDVISHAFTTSALTKASTVTILIAPASQGFTVSDGTLADNTVVNGVIGSAIRAKVITTGTYSGATSIAVHAVFKT